MKIEKTQAQMRKGILELCVLSIIAEEEAYPSDIIQKLKGSNLIVVEGTLYPLLTRLKNEGLLSYYWRESEKGPPRKYYNLTEAGNTFLLGLLDTWKQLVKAVNATTKAFRANKRSEERGQQSAARSQPSDDQNEIDKLF